MRGDLLEPQHTQPVWFGLGKDVQGLCNICHRSRTLTAQYAPEDKWVCQECFAKVFEETE